MTVWLVGGRDPTGGAGVDRDLATARAYAPELAAAIVVTAETLQGDGRPARATARAPAELERELAAMPAARAVKLGLVPDSLAQTVIEAARARGRPVVLDPVMQASDGGALGASAERLVRIASSVATLITPNLGEALALARVAHLDPDALIAAVASECAPAAVLLKGGHGDDPQRVIDRLWWRGAIHHIERARVPGPDPRGTGCALATAIACELARGAEIVTACERAIAWLDDARNRTVPGPDGRPHLAF
ncbi:MAG TPA: PfkB family carbohydrate kinase [Nannocystaceae bacterium]|nr:PfkB family carbohydrate kinase [Nannocystaceae bacterium]